MKTNKLILFLLLSGFSFLLTCKKVEKEMLVETGIASNIFMTTADVSGKILDIGEGVSAYGHCYAATPNTTVSGPKTEISVPASVRSFTSSLTGLMPGTKYFVAAYCRRGQETVYGDEISFTTLSDAKPVVTTAEITGIDKFTAVGGGNVTNEGGTPVTARGVCWSLAANPTTDNYKVLSGSGTGVFTCNLADLTSDKKYYVRAYATNMGGTSYGNEQNFTTLPDVPIAPTVTTAQVTSITSTSAVCGGDVTSEGSATVAAKGVCWSTDQDLDINDNKTIDGGGSGIYTSNIVGLNGNTTYYVRAYATSSVGTTYGNIFSFKTGAVLPSITTTQITSVTATGATSGGEMISDGGSTITLKGICWSTGQNPTVTENHTENGSGSGNFIANMTGMTPGTIYYVRAYATNTIGTVYGNELSFQTGILPPTLTTTEVSSITSTSAVSGGNITNNGGSPVTIRGVCWNTSGSPTTSDAKTVDGNGTGIFTSYLLGLNGNTTYYIRAYAINSAETAYGSEFSFKTGAVLPSITTSAVTSITSTTATSGGENINDGGSSVTLKGICWGTGQNPTISGSHTENGNGSGSFISNITGLAPGTIYYVRAYATNSLGISYGNELNFQTSMVGPTLTTTSITSITENSAISGGNITSDGGSSVLARGACWSTNPNPDVNDSKTGDGTGTGIYSSTLTNLSPGTTYYVRAYATNSAATSYGNEISFKTSAVLPTLTTVGITSITQISASSGGNITSDGGSTITARGICWSTSTGPTIINGKTNDGTGSGSFTSNLTGLSSNTIYYVRAYATNSVGTAYGNEVSFTTLAIVSTTALSNIAINTASGGGTIDAGGGASITSRGVCWSTSTNPTIANSKTTDGTGTGTFTSSLSGLTSNTIYYVRAYATNAGGTSYGNQQTFTSLASLTTTSVSSITATTAASGGSVTIGGGANITARGVCWSTSINPTIANSKTTDGTGTGSFTSILTGLTTNTIYYVRAYATNAGGTSYGNQQSFTSLATLTTTVISNITGNSATSGGNITAGGGASITVRGVCWSTSTNPTTSNSKTSNGTGTGSYTSNLTGLSRLITYYVRAYATNAGGTAYGDQKSFTTALCPASLTFTHTAGIVAPVTKTLTYGIVESNLSGANKCWITKNLGADNQAASATDATEAAAGWYWQFNRMQGFKHDGSTRTPSTSWITSISENSDWTLSNDPCNLLIGSGWRIPTASEWTNVDNNAGWTTYNDTYSSVFKIHAAGSLFYDSGVLSGRGSLGFYWSTVQYSDVSYGSYLWISSSNSSLSNNYKSRGGTVRCIQD